MGWTLMFWCVAGVFVHAFAGNPAAAQTLNHVHPQPWYSRASFADEDLAPREELKVTSISSDLGSGFGAGIERWLSISVGQKTYMVGLGARISIRTCVSVPPNIGSGQACDKEWHFDPAGTPLAADLFKQWDPESKVEKAYLVLALDTPMGDVSWYHITDIGLLLIRNWPIHKEVRFLKVFNVAQQFKVLILTPCAVPRQNEPCTPSADIYNFNLSPSMSPRWDHGVSLDSIATMAEIGQVGDELYLALTLPSSGILKLFKYDSPIDSDSYGNNTSSGKFEFWKDLSSPGISHAVFFHVSYKMYIAVGGVKPAIYRFVGPSRVEGCSEALKGLGFVSSWLVLPIPTYREEVVILAEAESLAGVTKKSEIVVLTWKGVGVFDLHTQIPCFVGDQKAVEGVSCILKGSKTGLRGALPIRLEDSKVVNLVVPRGTLPSAVFRVYIELMDTPNPLLQELFLLQEARRKLGEELTSQSSEIAITEKVLADTLQVDGSNVVTANWVIHEVYTSEHEVQGTPDINVAGQPGWSTNDIAVNIEGLQQLMQELYGLTKSLSDSLTDAAVPVDGELHITGMQALLGGLDIIGNSVFDFLDVSYLNGESVPLLLKEAVRKDSLDKIGGTKTLLNVGTEDVDFGLLNSVQRDDIIFNVADKPIVIDGNIIISEQLSVAGDVELPNTGTVSGIDLSEEVFRPGHAFKAPIHLHHVTVQGDLNVDLVNNIHMYPHNLRAIAMGVGDLTTNNTRYDVLQVDGRLTVERINGYLWDDIIGRVVWKNSSAHIENETVIYGGLHAQQGMDIWQLNGLDFPLDYIIKTTSSQFVTGQKTVGTMLVNSVDVQNTVDEVPVSSLVTLSTEQSLDGELKLTEANVYGDVKVDWGINGISLNQMQTKSPLLGQAGIVSSDVHFSNLEVSGHVMVSNTLDDIALNDFVSDILVMPSSSSDVVVIEGKKVFQSSLTVGGSGVTVSSGLLNGAKISEYARYDIPQTFVGEKNIEKVEFGNVHLTGSWDGVNVYELNADTVRIDEKQVTSSRLTFTDLSELWASRLVIAGQLNTELASTAVQKLTGNSCDISSIPGVECILKGQVSAATVRVAGNVIVDGEVCGWNLVNFENLRLSRSRPQTVTGDVTIGNVNVNSHLQLSSLNGVLVQSLGKTTQSVPYDLQQLLQTGGFAIDELFVDGNIRTTSGINGGYSMAYFAENAVQLTGNNILSGEILFEDVLSVGALGVNGPVNELNLSYLKEDAVLKYASGPITVSGTKVFKKGFNVIGNIVTEKLSGLSPSKIVTKSSPHTLNGQLRVIGNVIAADINMTGLLNGVLVSDFQNRYTLASENRHLLRGDAHFAGDVSVDDLFVMQNIQGIDMKRFFDSIVIKSVPTLISGQKLFINKVIFQNLELDGLVNNIDLREFAMDVVLYNDEDQLTTIAGKVTFANRLTTHNGVELSENLDAHELDGCLVKEWFDNAIYLAEALHVSGLKTFSSMSSNSDLKLSVLNAVDLSKVITLRTPQEIPGKIKFLAAAVKHDVPVGGYVNSRLLQSEFENTLMTSGDQIVNGRKTFLNGLTVRGNVISKGLISGRNLSNVVTLDSPQVIRGPMKFQSMLVTGNMRVSGHISSIDVQNWKERAVLKKSSDYQVVSGRWTLQGRARYLENVHGQGLVDGENLQMLVEAARQAQKRTAEMQEEVKGDWVQLCHDTNALLEKARAQPFLFQQLEVVQALPSTEQIASMHAFEANGAQYLAVSFVSDCTGAIYQWHQEHTSWELVDGAVENVGNIKRWSTLRAADVTYLATSSEKGMMNCPYNGGNVWRFGPGVEMRNIHAMEPWEEAQVDDQQGHLYTLGQSGVNSWHVQEGTVKPLHSWPLREAGRTQFVPRSLGLGLSLSDGETLHVLNSSHGASEPNHLQSRAANYLPGRNQGNIATMKVADGRKLVVVAAEHSDMLVVYEDVVTGQSLGRIAAKEAHSLCVMELTAPGRNGQTLLAFIEDERRLRVVEYKGVEGLVDIAVAKLAVSVKEMIPLRLPARGLVNQRHFLLLRSDYQVLLLEVEMAGDPLDASPLNCSIP